MPYGSDRVVFGAVMHHSITAESPVVTFKSAGEILKLFGQDDGGRGYRLLRERFKRLAGLSIHLHYGRTEEQANAGNTGEQSFIIKRYALPTRKELEGERAGQAVMDLEPGGLYGVQLDTDFFNFLMEKKNLLLVPIELLKEFIDKPTGWDYCCFLVHRCGAAESFSVVPHDALMFLFKDTPNEDDRKVIHRLQNYHRVLMEFTGGRLNATWVEQTVPSKGRGRPKKRWSLKIGPSKPILGKRLRAFPSRD